MLRSRRFSMQSTESPKVPNVEVDVGWVGPITLRRRAKPELDNERHREISLRLSVQEVKNLSNKGRYFCEVCLDRTLYARTTSKMADNSVFWGETFDLNNLPEISIMTINLYKQGDSTKERRQRPKGQNQFVAFVTIPLGELPQNTEYQQWLSMQSPQATSYVVNLDNLRGVHPANPIRGEEVSKGSTHTVNSPNGSRFRKKSTPVNCFRHSTSTSAFFGDPEEQHGRVNQTNISKKKTSWTTGFGTDVIQNGASVIPGNRTSSTTSSPNFQSAGSNFTLPENPLPQIRLNVQYEAVDILPIDFYGDLKYFIREKYLPLIRFLEPRLKAKQKEELASCFVNIHEKLPDFSIAQFIGDLLQEELKQNNAESMILRSNSLGSKAVECYIKLVGTEYLHKLLKGFIDHLLSSPEDFEIDPSRLAAQENSSSSSGSSLAGQLERNQSALIRNMTAIWRKIETSEQSLPLEMRQVFCTMSRGLERNYDSQAAAHLISSCLFLRFICPAIHGPVLFGLASSVPENGRISRNLTLVAKVLQNLANLSTFGEKEIHMKSLNRFVEQEIPAMLSFLRNISQAGISDESASTVPECHSYIHLGYEFAKMAKLLKNYTTNVDLPDELSELPQLLRFIDQHTTDTVFSSWSADVPPSRRLGHEDSTGQTQLVTSRPRYSSTDSMQRIQSEIEHNHSCHSSMNSLSNKIGEYDIGANAVRINGTKGNTAKRTCSVGAVGSSPACDAPTQPRFYLPTVAADHANPENMDELLTRYKEQLRQLNACIDQVGMCQPHAGSAVTHLSTAPFSGQDPIYESSEESQSPMNHSGSEIQQSVYNSSSPSSHNNEALCTSEYEYGNGREREETKSDHCVSEPIDVPEVQSPTRCMMPESPSLDQLAERLQELKLLLRHERQELEQVVATKTQVIKEREQSIEQLVSEIDQLRRAPQSQKVSQPHSNGRNISNKCTAETVSSSSSFTSECYSTGHWDNSAGNGDAFVQEDTTSRPHQHSNGSAKPHQPMNLRSQSFRTKAWSDRSEQKFLETAPVRYGPNLLDLTRASEGTGIPLGDLIVPKTAVQVRRRFSEFKIPNT
ncbi:unnamed protein product [Calicophoron daubneyi]|uniref:Ras GTPase-activating protein n=1 Tax=Calicophoron daubneyi TaxID=300641 RepID=A0AAV2TXB0_CALDB